MSEPDYAESYELRELEARVELLEALHAGGLAVSEQHHAMLRFLRRLSGHLSMPLSKENLEYLKEQVGELLAQVDGR